MNQRNLFRTTLLLIFSYFSISSLFAQNANFSGNFANIVTSESRPGWIKFQSGNELTNNEFLSSLNDGLNLNEDFAFPPIKTIKDNLGALHHQYQMTYKGVPVENHTWLLHEKTGKIYLAQGHAKPNFVDVPETPSLSEQNALTHIFALPDTVNYKRYAWQDAQLERNLKLVTGDEMATHFPKGTLVWAKNEQQNAYTLAYSFDIFVANPLSKKRYFINAHNRQIIKEIDLIQTNCFSEKHGHANHNCTTTKTQSKQNQSFADTPASGKANYVSANGGIVNFTSDFNGTDYTLKASNLGPDNNQVVHTLSANNEYNFDNLTEITDADNDWQDDSTAIGAHWGTEKVYDYFLTKHGRKSFDGNGAPLLSYVHYGSNYVNAFWNGVNMTYGDGNGQSWGALTSLDVIAHEIAHGVTENNGLGGMVYYSESGALNESFSDIFGVVFEFEYDPDGGDWLMGEDFDLANHNGFRSMSNPHDEGDPKTYYGTNWYTGFGDNAGVHTNSGVQNYWFYLMVNGGTGTSEYQYNYDVQPQTMDDVAAIMYRTLTTYMTPNATYLDARDGTIMAAIDLFGEGGPQHHFAEQAWCAVGVGESCLPSIEVLTPTLNSVLTAGSDYSITWNSTLTSVIPTVKIEYTTESGDNANWTLIEEDVPNNGSYDWFIPSIYSTSVRIRVRDNGDNSQSRPAHPLISDESRIFNILPCSGSESFTISGASNINQPVDFIGNIPGDSYEWLIDGNSVGTSQDLNYTFTNYGIYEITYKIENIGNNCFNIETEFVYIFPDDVCDAQSVDIGTSYLGSFIGTTIEPNEPRPAGGDCENSWCSNYINNSLWYSFIAPSSGIVNIDVTGVSYSSSKIALYENIDCNNTDPFQNAVLLAANDNKVGECCNGSELQKVCLTPGNTYYIQVAAQFETGDFNIIVEEKNIYEGIFENFSNCNTPQDWSLNGNGKGIGIFNDNENYECIGCGIRVYGGGGVGTATVELPIMDFTNFSNTVLMLDYGLIPQVDGEQNELRVEVATDCGAYTSIFSRSGTDLITNEPPNHSNGVFTVPSCNEIKDLEVDLSAYDGQSNVSIRLVAEGEWNNPLVLDNILVNQPNDTCRMLDSLVLVDIYNALDGPNWTIPWDFTKPLDSLYGVTLTPFGCVSEIDLDGEIGCLPCINGGNNLQGTIPATIGDLVELKNISLSRNAINGSIPSSIGNLVKLENLHFYNLDLTGTIPSEIGNLVNLTYLNLGNNQLSGTIPSEIGNLIELYYLRLQSNNLSGAIPTSLSNLTKLESLRLAYNDLTSLPDLSSFSQLYYLSLSGNPFDTNFPNWVNNMPNLSNIYANNCGWIGVMPDLSNLTNLYNINLGSNQLSGSFPDLSNSPNLWSCYLYYNQFSGSIPLWLGNMSNLYYLEINDNELSGIIPNFSNAINLHNLRINDNKFTFEDILPNFTANKTRLDANKDYSWQGYLYHPQKDVGITTSELLIEGNDYTFDLDIDDGLALSAYKWYQNGVLWAEVWGESKLDLLSVTNLELGVFTCEVTNPGAPDLTLNSRLYSLVESFPANNDVCDAEGILPGQIYNGTFLGASNEVDEPNAPGSDCESSWCESELNGSVWYSFVASTNPYISIKTGNSNTKIALYEGIDCNASNIFDNVNLIAANDYRPMQCCDGSIINLACLTTGETYYIQVEQNGAGQPDFYIELTEFTTCAIPCDLVVQTNYYNQESCPNSGDAEIGFYASSENGHAVTYELFDDNNQLLQSENYGNFYNLQAGTYKVVATSTSDAGCFLEETYTIAPKIDGTAPTITCLVDTINAAYLHSSIGLPWGNSMSSQMNEVFGLEKWHFLQYETVNANLLFSGHYNVVYLEGSSNSAFPLNNFIGAHQQLIEDWVAEGNVLYINVGSDNISSVNIGFDGVTLNQNYVYNMDIAMNNHPIIVGPNTPTGSSFNGNGIAAFGTVNLGNLQANSIIETPDNESVLVEADWVDGKVIIGTLAPQYWISPNLEISNIILNILEFAKTNTIPASNPTIELVLDENLTASLALNQVFVGATDDCDVPTVVLSQTDFSCADLGQQNIVLTASDLANNSASCSVSITVSDPNDYCSMNNDCPDDLAMDDTDMNGGDYNAKNITSTGTVEADTVVAFLAEESITLYPGFHAVPNADFTAKIEACPGGALLEEPIAQSRTTTPKPNSDLQVRPNPFKQSSMIDFNLDATQEVHLAVFSMGGQQLLLIQDGILDKGSHTRVISADGLKSGMYLIVLKTEKKMLTEKVMVVE